MYDIPSTDDRPIKIGSLFSGYGGLDLAVEHATGGRTVWFSELNEPVARVFSHHWPIPRTAATSPPSAGATFNRLTCCVVVSLPGRLDRRQGSRPRTRHRSGLWSYMATANEALQPRLVAIENVRGLLSAPATRHQTQGAGNDRNPDRATPVAATLHDLEPGSGVLGDEPARPLRALGAVLVDLADLRYDAQWIGLPASLVGAPHPRHRIFIAAHRQGTVSDTTGLGLLTRWRDPGPGPSSTRHDRTESPGHRPRPERASWLDRQVERIGDPVRARGEHLRRWGRYADAIARWEHITGRAAPAPAILNEERGPRPAPEFVQWLMGLPEGWVTESAHGLTANQQNTALGNGVLPLQALLAIDPLGYIDPSR